MSGAITMGGNAINTTQSTFTSGQLVSKNYVDTNAVRCTTGDLGLRIVRGNVNANRTIAQGGGFTVSAFASTGVYVINFSPAFTTLPSIAITPVIADATSGVNTFVSWKITPSETTVSKFQIIIGNNGLSSAIDIPFNFIAIGN
jgi:hypothetical protein